MDNKSILEIINLFVADEDKAFLANEQGKWYPTNHYRLTPILGKAIKIIPEQELRHLYFHLLRLNILLDAQIESTYSLWQEAYREQSYLMIKSASTVAERETSDITRFKGLIIFGFDAQSIAGNNAGYADYLLFKKAYAQFTKYSSIPGMLSKPERFVAFAQNLKVTERICNVLETLQYIQDDWYNGSPHALQYYCVVELDFWGGIYTLLLSPHDCAKKAIATFESKADLPCRDEHLEILGWFKDAVAKFRAR